MKPETKDKIIALKAQRDAAKAEWKNADKPASATVKSLDARLTAIEKLLGLEA